MYCTFIFGTSLLVANGNSLDRNADIEDEEERTCDLSRMTIDWIPCNSQRMCDNANFPQKEVSLMGFSHCPTGCRCSTIPKPPNIRSYKEESKRLEKEKPKDARGLICNGGWHLYNGMCYTITAGPVTGYDIQAACTELGDAKPVYTSEEEGTTLIVSLLKAMSRPHAWALLRSDKRPATPDWGVWLKCIYGTCKCTTISALNNKWATRNCDSKHPAACMREPRYIE